jgi:hypothetical protein
MKILKTYERFTKSITPINQSNIVTMDNINSDNDMNNILEYVYKNIESKNIPGLINTIRKINTDEVMQEAVFSNIKDKLTRYFDAKFMSYFIDKEKIFYTNLIGKLNKFDLTTIDDVAKVYPDFKMDAIYLAGGMDKAADIGAGWRNIVEYIFEVEHPGTKHDLEPVKLQYKGEDYEVDPSYIVEDYRLDLAIKGGKSYIKKNYDLPVIFNPVRKEVDRTKNPEFAAHMAKFKNGDFEQNDDFKEISKTFSESIEPDDEKILLLVDVVFFGVNEYPSAGTFGELQQASFLRKPIFAWYENNWKIEGHSPWTIPHLTKIMRSEDDVRMMVKTMINYNK